MRRTAALCLAVALAGPAPAAPAHEAALHAAASVRPEAPTAFPVHVDVRFSLTDQSGRNVTEADFRGRPMVVYFGYAGCRSICGVALPALARALELLGPDGARIAPVLITVDPAHDTPAAMARSLPHYSPRLIGLTGSEAALARVRAAFQVEAKQLGTAHDGTPIFAHGSFLYLIGADGQLKTLVPPVLSPQRMAELIRKYL